MIPNKTDPKYVGFRVSPGAQKLIEDLYSHISKQQNILQVVENQLIRGMTSIERKHTIQHITDILNGKDKSPA